MTVARKLTANLSKRVANARQDVVGQVAAGASIEAIGTDLTETIDELRRLVHGVMPAVLVECGYMNSHKDLAKLVTASAQQTIANGIVAGLSDFDTEIHNL